jgi:hypothetical protein
MNGVAISFHQTIILGVFALNDVDKDGIDQAWCARRAG